MTAIESPSRTTAGSTPLGREASALALIAIAAVAGVLIARGKLLMAAVALGLIAVPAMLRSRRLLVGCQWLAIAATAVVIIFSPWSGHRTSALAQYILVGAATVGIARGSSSARLPTLFVGAAALLLAAIVLTTPLSAATVQDALRTYLLIPLVAAGFRPMLRATRSGRYWLGTCRVLAAISLLWMLAIYVAPTGSSISEVQGFVQPYRGVRLHFNDVTYLLAAYPLVEVWAALTRRHRSVIGGILSAGALIEVLVSELRTAWLLVLVGCVYAILRQRKFAVRLAATFLLLTAVVGVYTASSLVRTRTEQVASASDPSRAFRQQELTQIDLPAIEQNPGGYGVGSVARNGGLTSAGGFRFPGAHSSIVFSLLEIGVVGTIALLAIAAIPAFRKRQPGEAFPLDGCVATAVCSTLLISPTLLTLPISVVLGLCVGRALVIGVRQR